MSVKAKRMMKSYWYDDMSVAAFKFKAMKTVLPMLAMSLGMYYSVRTELCLYPSLLLFVLLDRGYLETRIRPISVLHTLTNHLESCTATT